MSRGETKYVPAAVAFDGPATDERRVSPVAGSMAEYPAASCNIELSTT
jgi:hypothetical protein